MKSLPSQIALEVPLPFSGEASGRWFTTGCLGLSLLSIATTLLLIDFVREPQSRLASALEWRPLRVVGQLSYAMYLVHFQAIDLGRHLLFTHPRPATILNFLTDYLVFVALSIAAAAIPTGSWNARF